MRKPVKVSVSLCVAAVRWPQLRLHAQYVFDQMIQGFTISFPIKFVKENGVWKIVEY